MFLIDHVQLAMPAGEEAATRRFYGGLLGLSEISKPVELAKRGGVWFALRGGQQLHLGVEQEFRPAKKAHPCFVADDYDQLANRLTNAGFQVQHDNLNPPVRRFFVHDPFGNRLEFADRCTTIIERNLADQK